MISIVACCHNAKLCVHAAHAFLTNIFVFLPWAPNQRAIFWLKGFFHYAVFPVVRALDWLSSLSGTKIIAQNKDKN